ncbi:hypothetical protein [Bacillus sp. PK3_68]|uniref:hypothetical protein n=1 Tax=Bacillus sp. PK3_68 TaxID=2027408 RepID=UPI001600C595|nr:hypothetical protein [Bacillus sp. PK3_68]
MKASFLPFYGKLLEQARKDIEEQIKEQVAGRLAALAGKSEAAHYKKLIHELKIGLF